MTCYVIGGRRSRKTIVLVRKAVENSLETGMPAAVTSDLTMRRILEEASRQGVAIPEPVVVKSGAGHLKGITFAGILVDEQF